MTPHLVITGDNVCCALTGVLFVLYLFVESVEIALAKRREGKK